MHTGKKFALALFIIWAVLSLCPLIIGAVCLADEQSWCPFYDSNIILVSLGSVMLFFSGVMIIVIFFI
jgi:hypothetical protein